MHGCSFWCPSPSFLQVSHVTVCPAAGRFKLYMLLTTAGSVGLELTKTASGTVVQQGAPGKYATVGQRRKRGGKHVRDKQNRRMGRTMEVKVGTVNVGTMTDKGRELADVMVKRKVDILCVQETRWKGSKVRRWLQNILPWRRWKEKWSCSYTEGRVHRESVRGEESF